MAALFAASAVFLSCSCSGGEPDSGPIIGGETGGGDNTDLPGNIDVTVPESSSDAVAYEDIYDKNPDNSWFNMPVSSRVPKAHWTCVDVIDRGDRNDLGLSENTRGLQYHLLCQSLAGLVNRALEQGKTDIGIWLENSQDSYSRVKATLGPEIGRQTGVELLSKVYGDWEGMKVNVRELIDGYVLTDVERNPESAVVATVASHVYNSVIVDVRDREYFDNIGLTITYDATNKTTEDAWHEFKDRCSNKALVLMPVQTGELREYAVKNNLFFLNLNKKNGTSTGGVNTRIMNEILAWLAPGASVLGWESASGEDVFVSPVSAHGRLMLAADWSSNHGMTSAGAVSHAPALAKVINPRKINYSASAHYVSFFLSDGDNYQWIMNGFDKDFYSVSSVIPARMSFGICSQALEQLAPVQEDYLFSKQADNSTLMECFGGGYFYVDDYATKSDRKAGLELLAERTAASMKAHRLKVLHLMAHDVNSDAAKEAYKAFINANDQLEGIVVIQYSPYNGGHGNIMWFANKEGYDIPVISAAYSLWNGSSEPGQGTPVEIAARMKAVNDGVSHDLVCVHAWSDFSGKKGAAAALQCITSAGDSYKAVSVQELIWRIRMKERKEQTLKYLKTIK